MRIRNSIGVLIILGGMALSACSGEDANATPTLSVDQIQTQAIQTFESVLTQTALAYPTATFTPPASPTPFATLSFATPLASATSLAGGGAASCYKLVYIRDVTIPDNTTKTPGETFTKTWEVQNSGSCAWEAGFKFTFVSGDAMGGQTLSLAQAVPIGSTTQLSVAMTAPTNKTGTIQGTWRMSTASGIYFGDALTVVIVIGSATSTATTAATAAATSTPTPTPTPTPTETTTP